MIIDVHAHLGDILNINGGSLIKQKDIKMPRGISLPSIFEALSMRTWGAGTAVFHLISESVTKSHQKRVAAATLENMQDSMRQNGVIYTVCMPIAPYVTFDDLWQVHQNDHHILAFSSVDFSSLHDIKAELKRDIEKGALGLKLHPIIQKVSLQDERVGDILQLISVYKLPVLVHTGEFWYYRRREAHRMVPEYGHPRYVAELARNFPDLKFIIGHAGLFQCDEVIKRLKTISNVWVDTSFQSPEHIRRLAKAFGEDKVLFASDWPYGMVGSSIKTVRKACRGDANLENMFLYRNAANLLGLSE